MNLKRTFNETVANRKRCHSALVKKLRTFCLKMEDKEKSHDWRRKDLKEMMKSFGQEYMELVDSFPPANEEINEEGETALEKAISSGSLETVQYMVEELDFSVNFHNNQRALRSPLMVAAGTSHVPIVRYLIDRKALVNYESANGMTALLHCVQHGSTGVLRVLIRNKAEISENVDKIVDLACLYHRYDTFLELLRCTGLQVSPLIVSRLPVECMKTILNLKSVNVQMLYRTAEEEGNVDIMRALIETNKIKLNSIEVDSLGTRSPIVNRVAKRNKIQLLQYLVHAKADLNVADEWGYLPLHYAIEKYSEKEIKLLVDAKADITNRGGRQLPIVTAVQRGIGVEILLAAERQNIYVNKIRSIEGKTLMCVAVEADSSLQNFNKKFATINFLLDAKADINAYNNDGNLNPLLSTVTKHLCSRTVAQENLMLVEALISKKANVLAQDQKGWTCTMHAKKTLITHQRRLHWMEMRRSVNQTPQHKRDLQREAHIARIQGSTLRRLKEQERREIAKGRLREAVTRDLEIVRMLHTSIFQACDLENLKYTGATQSELQAKRQEYTQARAPPWLW